MAQITITNLFFTYEGDYTPVFEGLDLQWDTGWKLGLVGRNGRGKTTLLRLLAGELEGRGTIAGRPPVPALARDGGAAGAARPGPAPGAGPARGGVAAPVGAVQAGTGRRQRWSGPFPPSAAESRPGPCWPPCFWTRGATPCWDEPTNHLDGPGRALVARYLRELDRGFLLVSHDRAFLDGCTDHTLALNRTGPELIRGSFSVWYQEKEARDRGELAQNERLKGEIRRLEQAARRTAVWSDRVERSKYGSENSGLKVDRGFVGHKSAKLMKRAKGLEGRQQEAIAEKSALLKDVERADSLKLAPPGLPQPAPVGGAGAGHYLRRHNA